MFNAGVRSFEVKEENRRRGRDCNADESSRRGENESFSLKRASV